MSYRLSKIYTRTGDDGTTSLAAKHRISKNSLRIEAVGTIDELNCAVGLTLSFGIKNPSVCACFLKIQNDLFDLGGELCPPHRMAVTAEKITWLENQLDEWNQNLPPLTEFILPGGNPVSASCHMARAICRRAERSLVALHETEPLNADMLRYINRLSDLLFVAARVLARESESSEILWKQNL